MTNPGNPVPAPRWPLPDPRSHQQRELDKPTVQNQVDILTLPNADAGAKARLDAVLELIRQRQVGTPNAQTKPFVSFQPAGAARPVLAVENELVIDADDQQLTPFAALLTNYTRSDRAGRRARIYRSKSAKSLDDLRADAKRFRDKKITANINQIVPLGYVIKGDAYPGLTTGQAPLAKGVTDASVRVAIVDTGLTGEARTDAWFTGFVRNGTDPLNVLKPLDRNDWFAGHGTFAAGCVRQIAPDCEVVIYRFTGPDGIGTDIDAADMLIKAADEAAGRRLIINASFGAPAVDGAPPPALQEAVDYIAKNHPQVLIVASAGNDGSEVPLYPAAFAVPQVKAVGALNPDLTGATFSNRGTWVHCSAVGVGVVSTFVKGKLPPEDNLGVADLNFPDNSWATWSGTSFTAPQISGAVAYLCGQNPALQPQAAFDDLIADRPTLDKFGAVVHLLRGTPPA
jgi:subtilisin family serine protease